LVGSDAVPLGEPEKSYDLLGVDEGHRYPRGEACESTIVVLSDDVTGGT
jgi:hypothetical protein